MASGDASRLTRPLQPMPDHIERALRTRRLEAAYRARPPYQRNDYLGWIARAKRPETRTRRVTKMLEELAAGEGYMGMAWRPKA